MERIEVTVENLNPRSRAVSDLRMSCMRAIEVMRLCEWHLKAMGDDPAEAQLAPPHTFEPGEKRMMSTQLKKLWGEHYWLHPEYRQWPKVFSMWSRGVLEGMVLDMLENLPAAAREKVEAELRKVK